MLSEMIQDCRLRKEYGCNSLRPPIDSVLDRLRDFESIAGNDYTDAFVRLTMKKGSYLLSEGEISHHVWFLEKGVARLFVWQDSKDITSDFFFSSEFIGSYDTSTLKIRSGINIQLLTNATLYSISWTKLEVLKKHYPELIEIEKNIVACYLKCIKTRVIEFQMLSPTERYLKLIREYPYIIHQVSCYMIASYLGISKETFSRIRARVKKRK